jgi:hypothetical protein
MLKRYTIYGERCSGTNYLENIMDLNFDVKVTWDYGWKHFFGFDDAKLKKSDDTLFICIVRNPVDWINSFYRELHHLPLLYKKHLSEEEKKDEFLNKEVWSIHNDKKENMVDRNMYTGDRYKNIFELRHTKIKWMIEDLPNKVKNYIFIKYEDLVNDFDNILLKIKDKRLKVKDNIIFPVNTSAYKNSNQKYVEKKNNNISPATIFNNPGLILFYEEILNYTNKKNPDEKNSDEKKSEEKKSDEKNPEEKKSDEKKSDEKNSDEKNPGENKSDENTP